MPHDTLKIRSQEPETATDIRSESDAEFLARSKPDLEVLETIRRAKLKIYNFRKKLAIPAVAVITPILSYIDYWLLMLQSGNDDKGAGLSIAFLGLLYWWVTQPRRQYAVEYKKRILPDIAKLFGNLYYDIAGRIDMGLMEPSKIVPAHDKYETEDYFSGEYKGVRMQFSEINLKQRRRSKKRTYYVTIFKGLAVLLEMNGKRFYGHTILDRDKSKLGEWFREKSTDLKRANLVDPEFEKLFDAYTNDQTEARYLIDPLMIERLKGLYAEYEGEKMTAAFYDSKMLILIASKHNHFEPAKLEVPATDPQSILSMKKEIGEILSIIDRLDLYDPEAAYRS